MMPVPFISQIETWPLLAFCHRMSEWPSPLKSPVPTAVQPGPGLGLTAPPPITLVPFISQIAACPLAFCNRMSASPSALKSPVPTAFQLGPGLGPSAAPADDVGPVHLPDRDLPVRVLPQDVGMAVAVEVARADLVPARPGVGGEDLASASDLAGRVHLPDGDLAVVVVPLDVGEAVGVEVAIEVARRRRRDPERRRILDVRGDLDRAGGRSVRPEQTLAHAVEGIEFNAPR